jgi:hypothetical protein
MRRLRMKRKFKINMGLLTTKLLIIGKALIMKTGLGA